MSVFLSLKKQIKSFLKLQFTWFLKKVNHPFKRVNNEKIEKNFFFGFDPQFLKLHVSSKLQLKCEITRLARNSKIDQNSITIRKDSFRSN